MSVRSRIFFAIAATTVAVVWYLVAWIISELEPRYRASVEASLVDTAHILASLLETELGEAPMVDTGRIAEAMRRAGSKRFEAAIYEVVKDRVDMRVYVTDARGLVLYDSMGKVSGQDYSRWRDVKHTLEGKYGARTSADEENPEASVLHVGAPVYSGGEIVGVVTVGQPTSGLRQFLALTRRRIIAASALAGLSVLALGLLASFLITRPVEMGLEYLRLLRHSRHAGLPRLGRSAIGIIGRTFDEMREALEGRSYTERYVQTLTHELKSPLSAIRGSAELLQERHMDPGVRESFLQSILAETEHIQELVDRMLELASLEKRRGLEKIEPVPVREVVGEIVELLAPAAAGRRVEISVSIDEGLVVDGERFLIRQALMNLIKNAIDFSPEHGVVEIEASGAGGGCTVTVSDRGPGIPAYAESKVFDRFYSLERPGSGKKSTGLGLTFVKEIAELHHGSVELTNRPDGGARAILRLR